MKTERDVFDKWHFLQWKLHNAVTDTVDFAKVLYDRVYSHDHTSSVREVEFKAWTASAQREGYKLVSVEKLEELKRDADRMISSAHLYQDECHIKSFGRSFLHNYKDMIGAFNNE